MKIFYLILSLSLLLLAQGCASAQIMDGDGVILYQIETRGFARNAEFDIVKPDGTRIHVKTESTTANVLQAGNEILGTVVNAAEKAKP